MRKNYISIIVILIMLVLLALAMSYSKVHKPTPKFTTGSQTTSTSSNIQPVPSSQNTIPVISFASSTVNTADWKVYKNEQYGFEFKYPGNWYVATDTPGFLSFQSNQTQENSKKNHSTADPFQQFDFAIYNYSSIKNFHYYNYVTASKEFDNLDAFFNYVYGNNSYYPNIKINGVADINGVKLYDTDDKGDFIDNYISLQYNNKFFDLVFPQVDIDPNVLSTKAAILQSLRFTK